MLSLFNKQISKQDELQIKQAKLIEYCQDLDKFTNLGFLSHCINREYKYLGKTYTALKYRLSLSGNLILYNDDYNVIYATNNKCDFSDFLNKLYMGVMENP